MDFPYDSTKPQLVVASASLRLVGMKTVRYCAAGCKRPMLAEGCRLDKDAQTKSKSTANDGTSEWLNAMALSAIDVSRSS